jgi:hypothetical protein
MAEDRWRMTNSKSYKNGPQTPNHIKGLSVIRHPIYDIYHPPPFSTGKSWYRATKFPFLLLSFYNTTQPPEFQ